MSCLCSISPEPEIYAPDILTSEQKARLRSLKKILEKNGLELRNDSRLCFHYVMCGFSSSFDLQWLVKRLKRARYLHECSFIEKGHKNAHLAMAKYTMLCLSQSDYYSFVRRNVLLEVAGQRYPPETYNFVK